MQKHEIGSAELRFAFHVQKTFPGRKPQHQLGHNLGMTSGVNQTRKQESPLMLFPATAN
jgi:hypothetical protein